MWLAVLVTPVAGASLEVAYGARTAAGTAPLPLLRRASMEKKKEAGGESQRRRAPLVSETKAQSRHR